MRRWLTWVLAVGAATVAAQQAAPPLIYVPFRNAEFKFATEVPATWQAEKQAPGAFVFSGPKGGDEYYTTIIFQIVPRRTQGEDSADVRARDIQRQWATAAKYQLISQEKGTLAGSPAITMIAQYQSPGGPDMYKQEQIVCEKGPNFYLISYAAPLNLYATHHAKMEHALKAFQFLP
jgi:hypothetical protein